MLLPLDGLKLICRPLPEISRQQQQQRKKHLFNRGKPHRNMTQQIQRDACFKFFRHQARVRASERARVNWFWGQMQYVNYDFRICTDSRHVKWKNVWSGWQRKLKSTIAFWRQIGHFEFICWIKEIDSAKFSTHREKRNIKWTLFLVALFCCTPHRPGLWVVTQNETTMMESRFRFKDLVVIVFLPWWQNPLFLVSLHCDFLRHDPILLQKDRSTFGLLSLSLSLSRTRRKLRYDK